MANLKEGDKAPDFAVPDAEGNVVKLKDLRGKRVVLYFYPKDDTPGCTAQACSLRDNNAQIIAKGAGVLGGDGLLNKLKTAAGFADRVTFIIDENGIITHILDKPDVDNHAEEVLALL